MMEEFTGYDLQLGRSLFWSSEVESAFPLILMRRIGRINVIVDYEALRELAPSSKTLSELCLANVIGFQAEPDDWAEILRLRDVQRNLRGKNAALEEKLRRRMWGIWNDLEIRKKEYRDACASQVLQVLESDNALATLSDFASRCFVES